MKNTQLLTVVLVLLAALSIALASQLTVHSCISKCMNEVEHGELCRASCEHKDSLPDLEVFVDGQKIVPQEDIAPMDDKYDLSKVKFDNKFYNTPETFSDIVNFKGQLLNAFYGIAEKKFKVPGRKYNPGTMIHLLKVPIPLTNSQFNNQEFMNKLLDVVPKGQREYEPASTLQLSEAYKEFLLSVKVDKKTMKDAPSSASAQAEIRKREQALDKLLDVYISHAEKCYSAYQNYIIKNVLSPISYTLDAFSPKNAHCRAADAKLKEHSKRSQQLADYVESLNPYNQLFVSIAKVTHNKMSWDYSKSDIQQFADFHRNLDEKNIQTSSTSYSIPVTIKREFFNHKYFGGSSATYSEKNIDARLTFSGVGWKETAISPNPRWFDLFTIQKYRKSPLNSKKDFFGSKGLLQRIPSYMLIAYKPVMKVKISKEMKDGFSKTATTHKLRPVESGPFVFTKVEIRTNKGGKTKEEYEMILECNIRQPQVIAFKSTPIVHIPKAPAPAPPAYLKYVNKQLSFRTPHKTYMKVSKSAAGAPIVSNSKRGPEERWIVRGTTDNRVYITSTWGHRLSCNKSKAETSKSLNDNSKFTMIQNGKTWTLRAANGRYLRVTGSKSGSRFDCVTSASKATKLSISVHNPHYLQFLNKKVTIQASNKKYLRGNNEGNNVVLNKSKGTREKWRVVDLGYERIGFLSHNGRYLDAPNDTFYTKKKKILWVTVSKKRIRVPAKVRISSGINDCKKFTLRKEGSRFALKPACRSGYIKVNSDKELGLHTKIYSTSKFSIALA